MKYLKMYSNDVITDEVIMLVIRTVKLIIYHHREPTHRFRVVRAISQRPISISFWRHDYTNVTKSLQDMSANMSFCRKRQSATEIQLLTHHMIDDIVATQMMPELIVVWFTL